MRHFEIFLFVSLNELRFLTPWRSCDVRVIHYNDVIMSAMEYHITSLTFVYSTVYSRRRSKKIPKPRVTGLCVGNSPVTGEFPTQRASSAEKVSIWWRHHVGVLWPGLSIWVSPLHSTPPHWPGTHHVTSNCGQTWIYEAPPSRSTGRSNTWICRPCAQRAGPRVCAHGHSHQGQGQEHERNNSCTTVTQLWINWYV